MDDKLRNKHVDQIEIQRAHEQNHQKMKAIERARADFDWPLFFVAGESHTDNDNFVEAYYKVEEPDGPISYRTPDGDPRPTTMIDLVFEAQQGDLREIPFEETPWWTDE